MKKTLILISLSILFLFIYSEINNNPNKSKNSKSSINLNKYTIKIDGKEIKEIKKNLSGITYSSSTNLLYAVTNSPRRVYELTKNGEILREIILSGFKDTEGITYIKNDLFSVIDEERQTLYIFKINKDTKRIHKKDVITEVKLNVGILENFGLEGIAYNSREDDFYLVNERLPMAVLKVSNVVNEKENLKISREDYLNNFNFLFSDFSGAHFHSTFNNIFLLSDQGKLLHEVSLGGDLLSILSLEKGKNGLKNDILQAEGITLDEKGDVYIVSEPNLFYRFERKTE